MAKQPTKRAATNAAETTADRADRLAAEATERNRAAAEDATKTAEDEGRLPATMAVTNPAPAKELDAASGAFIEPEIKAAIPMDHPSVDNNPRSGTSAVQNGADFNDPRGRNPGDEGFTGQGLDLSVYGKG